MNTVGFYKIINQKCAILSHSNPAIENGFDILRKELS